MCDMFLSWNEFVFFNPTTCLFRANLTLRRTELRYATKSVRTIPVQARFHLHISLILHVNPGQHDITCPVNYGSPCRKETCFVCRKAYRVQVSSIFYVGAMANKMHKLKPRTYCCGSLRNHAPVGTWLTVDPCLSHYNLIKLCSVS